MIDRFAKYLWGRYRSLSSKGYQSLYLNTKAKMIGGLSPGVDVHELVETYYIRKIRYMLLCIIVAVVLMVLLLISRHTTRLIDEENKIKREEYGGNSYEASVVANYKDDDYEMDIVIKEREYTKQDIDALYKECLDMTEDILKDENTSLDHVTKNLNTFNTIKGYPFYVYWETSDYSLLHDDGTVINDNLTTDKQTCRLTAHYSYKDLSFEHSFDISIYPRELDIVDKTKKEIIDSISRKQDETQYDSYLTLPSLIGDSPVSFKESRDCVPLMMATLMVVLLLGIWLGVDNDLTRKYKKRNQQLSLEYSEFVSKLQLLIGSGMTLRTALDRMGIDYLQYRNQGGNRKYSYEELVICIKRMKDGAGEEESLNLFGKRCNHIAYKKLVSLLNQNTKKGTTGLMAALSNETKMAFEERKQIAKRMGEEAQTKLLFPMIMMLIVVMVIIIVPAYVSFGI